VYSGVLRTIRSVIRISMSIEIFKYYKYVLFYMQKKVTLSIDEEVYEKFQKFCEENDIMLSKRIERLIKEHLEERKK